ncbi:MAG: hypothetical protein DWQ18_08860 [Crenarchaeota archaeon]|nr:MAG: hypothetical protein DWQ17_00925 [Thermoproteota archaeon]RDJ33246.1 MAG: hypothetical protein DWQ18_08860 [Thermoproteota archaeon]RDJ36251.1 MAG: hypothetical protein DWQ19_06460 [Thermoproteota archaeon]RDJ38881.1 MAG: hypothetical protein DWQ13_00925 [Thermoproteota archaeon]
MNNYFLFGIISLILIAGTSEVYGHGLGSVESESIKIGNDYLKVKVETNPDVLKGDENEIDFSVTTIDVDSMNSVSSIEYNIEIHDGQTNDLIASFDAFSPEQQLSIKIIPDSKLNYSGEKTPNGKWIGTITSPLVIKGPLFLEGGLVNVKVTILSINGKTISGNDRTFETLLTIGEYIPFEIDIKNKKYHLMFATYFDKIEEFSFDEKNKKLTALMPFNWDKKFIEKIPFVHAEYYLPKSITEFNNHDILMTVNDISILGTIDRSGDEEIVVHFLIPTQKLLKLYDQIPANQRDRIVFGIESGNQREVEKSDAILEEGEKSIKLSTQEDWKFHLWLSPKGKINPNNDVTLNIEFHDPVSNALIPQISYDLDVLLNGKTVKSQTQRETPDGKDSIRVKFDTTGAAIVKISNVNNFDTSGEFSFRVSEAKEVTTKGDHEVSIRSGSSSPGCERNDSCYEPKSISVQQNEVVVWKNNDNAAHTVTSGIPSSGPSGVFDSGIIATKQSFSYKFSSAGDFDYFCTLHPWMIGSVSVKNASDDIPQWVKNNAKWWSDEQISDKDFAAGLEYLINEKIINVPASTTTQESTETTIPNWLRTNAKWWSDGTLSNSEFLQGVEWMITNGIIRVGS